MKALDIPSTETAKCCRSTAKLDRDTFTTVASICDINEPSIATEATFQMPEGSLSALVSRLDNGFEDLLPLTDSGEARKDCRECEFVHLLRERAAGVLHRNERETQPGTLTQCALHTYVGGDAGQHHGLNPTVVQFMF